MIRNILTKKFSNSFTLQVWIAFRSPFTFQALGPLLVEMTFSHLLPFELEVSFEFNYDVTSTMLSAHIHRQVRKYPSGYPIPMINYTQSHTICVFSTHASLYGINLHTMSKDLSTYSYPPNMGTNALRSQNINSISSLQGKILHSWDLGQPYTTI